MDAYRRQDRKDDLETVRIGKFFKKYRAHIERRKIKEAIAKGDYEYLEEDASNWAFAYMNMKGVELQSNIT